MYTHYFINYEHEFIRRGLVGEAFRQFSIPVSNATTSAVYSAGFAFFWLSLVACFLRSHRKIDTNVTTVLFLFVASCPAILVHFAYLDFGRYDVFLAGLLMSSMLVTFRFSPAVSISLVIALQSLAVLIHEASLLLTAPAAICIWIALHGNRIREWRAVIFYLPIAIIGTVVWWAGKITSIQTARLAQEMQALSGDGKLIFPGVIGAASREVTMITKNLQDAPLVMVFEQHLIFAGGMIFFFVFTSLTCLAFWRLDRRAGHLICISAASPLLMYPLGHDFFRWWTFAFLNTFMLISALSVADSRLRDTLCQTTQKWKPIVLLAILSGIALGGTGDLYSFKAENAPIFMLVEAVVARI